MCACYVSKFASVELLRVLNLLVVLAAYADSKTQEGSYSPFRSKDGVLPAGPSESQKTVQQRGLVVYTPVIDSTVCTGAIDRDVDLVYSQITLHWNSRPHVASDTSTFTVYEKTGLKPILEDTWTLRTTTSPCPFIGTGLNRMLQLPSPEFLRFWDVETVVCEVGHLDPSNTVEGSPSLWPPSSWHLEPPEQDVQTGRQS